jgi:hypothetical protein
MPIDSKYSVATAQLETTRAKYLDLSEQHLSKANKLTLASSRQSVVILANSLANKKPAFFLIEQTSSRSGVENVANVSQARMLYLSSPELERKRGCGVLPAFAPNADRVHGRSL